MEKTAVIYKSKYGSAKQYAKWIAAALNADLFELAKDTSGKLGAYSTIIYGAGIYAGNIAGMSSFKQMFKSYPDKCFILYTAGLAPPKSSKAYYKSLMDRMFTSAMHAKVKAFHFRGGIDYSLLSFAHRFIMGFLVKMLSKKKPETLSDTEKGLISTHGKSVSYVEESAIEPLLVYVLSVNENT